ncbi:MAG: endonuclease VIII [Deltaproteobacteria bacterium]|nr:endonuclease VIII [Deltaproteobacteria bacterium]
MPERPDLAYWVEVLTQEVVGRTVEQTITSNPVIVRSSVALDQTPAFRFDAVRRHSNFVVFECSDQHWLIISPMLAGRFSLSPQSTRQQRSTAVRWELDDARSLRYLDQRQMGKVYRVPRAQTSDVPGFEKVGADILAPAFDVELFLSLAKGRRDQVRVFLMDKAALDCIGNAYADEVLWEARIHPKTFVRALSEQQLFDLHQAIIKVHRDAIAEIARRRPALDDKVRDFLKVRGRHKQPCPRCESPIRKAGVRGYDAFFCPQCQPDGRQSAIVNWRRVDRAR